MTGNGPQGGSLLRKRSPSGTERVRISDPSIIFICSKRLAQHLVDFRRPDTRPAVFVNPASWISRDGYLPFAPKWERVIPAKAGSLEASPCEQCLRLILLRESRLSPGRRKCGRLSPDG